MALHRIMVVDDDPDVRFVVSSLLGMDFETMEATNGLDALEKIDRYEPDLLLMDISMPLMNGIACCHAIQRNPGFEKTPVIFLSASSDPAVRSQAFSAGGAGFFEKPFNTADLIQFIQAQFLGMEVQAKRFSISEISRLDAMPLLAVESQSEQAPAPDDSRRQPTLMIDPPEVEGRQRRVFGKPKEPLPPEPAAPLEEEPPSNSSLLPPPPAPDYGRAGEDFKRRQAAQQRPAPSAPAPASPPPPPVAKPVASPAKPPAPQAPAPVELTPAEILTQRRLSAIGRPAASASAAIKPRVLVIIDAPEQLKTCHEALRGAAEFLPLEDPVEALILIARFQPDIVVMGIQEEGYSGLQIAQMMRSNRRLAHIEIIFIQSRGADAGHLSAARTYSKNAILRRPITDAPLRDVLEEITRRSNFQIRQKNLPYGAYVTEVLRAADEERGKQNKAREKQAAGARYQSLTSFMANELKDYKEPKGYDELKGIGHKEHRIRG